MEAIKYDLEKLEEDGNIAAKNAVARYYTYQDYFNGLTGFVNECRHYLRSYTPAVVIYSDDVRKSFTEDCMKIRAVLSQLGLEKALLRLNGLEDALLNSDIKSLSDGLGVFYATLDITAKAITKARVLEQLGKYLPAKVKDKNQLILAVVEQPAMLASLTLLLSDQYRVITLLTSKDAAKVLPMHNPDLFLLDAEMPVVGGYELALLIREDKRFYRTPILFLTNEPKKYMETVMQYHNNFFSCKPVGQERLLKKISAILAASQRL